MRQVAGSVGEKNLKPNPLATAGHKRPAIARLASMPAPDSLVLRGRKNFRFSFGLAPDERAWAQPRQPRGKQMAPAPTLKDYLAEHTTPEIGAVILGLSLDALDTAAHLASFDDSLALDFVTGGMRFL